MKTVVKRLARDEKGQALVMVLILLLIGGLIIGPLLSYMGTGLNIGNVYETRTAELYAADAGAEDAVWKIQQGEVALCPGQDQTTYNITDVNGKSIEVSIEFMGEGTYRITSIAATADGGGTAAITGTAIEAYLSVSYLDFSALLDNAIVSQNTITILGQDTLVDGDVWLPDEDDLHNKHGNITGEVKDEDDMSITWPTFEQLSGVYWEDVAHLETEAYPDGYVIDITGTSEEDPYVIGPLLAAGDLTINGNGWIELDGTIYVQGTLFTNPTPEIHIALEGHTIFAEVDIKLNPGVWLHGSGCIIARYDIDFQPNLDAEGENFVLVLSLEGEVKFNPGTSFTGCIAGNAHVELKPGNTINWVSPEGKGLDVPWGAGGADETPIVTWLSIESWEVIPLWRE